MKKKRIKKQKHWECKKRCITLSLTGNFVCPDCPFKNIK